MFIDPAHVLRDLPAEKINLLRVSDEGQRMTVDPKYGRSSSHLKGQVEVVADPDGLSAG